MIPLPASLTMADAAAATAALVGAVGATDGPEVTLDASALHDVDTAAVATLLACRRAAQAVGKTFKLHAVPPRLAALTRLYGVDELLGCASPA